VVAAAVVRRWGWPVAATIAVAFIGILAFRGERPEPGLVRFRAAGLLVDWAIEDVMMVAVSGGGTYQTFHRVPGGGWRADDGGTAPSLTERIETGLKLLHNSPPERRLTTAEFDDRSLAEFGLDPPRLAVTAQKAQGGSVTIYFGAVNPIGLARYTRIDGKPEIVLLPSFVAEAWERVARLQ